MSNGQKKYFEALLNLRDDGEVEVNCLGLGNVINKKSECKVVISKEEIMNALRYVKGGNMTGWELITVSYKGSEGLSGVKGDI